VLIPAEPEKSAAFATALFAAPAAGVVAWLAATLAGQWCYW